MKIKNNIIIIYICLIIFSSEIKAEEQTINLENVGNILENNYIVSNNMYGIIFNKTETNFKAARIGAINYCKNSMANNDASVNFYPIKKHSSYFSCVTSVQNKMYQYNLSENEGLCVNYLVFDMNYLYNNNQSCKDLNDQLIPIFNEIKEKIKFEDNFNDESFIIKVISEQYSEIMKLENDLITEPNNLIINKNIETCKKYSFKEGSEIFAQCIFKLIELGEYLLENKKNSFLY